MIRFVKLRGRFGETKAVWPIIQAGIIDRGVGGPPILRLYFKVSFGNGKFFGLYF
jgi:hypothetical protein